MTIHMSSVPSVFGITASVVDVLGLLIIVIVVITAYFEFHWAPADRLDRILEELMKLNKSGSVDRELQGLNRAASEIIREIKETAELRNMLLQGLDQELKVINLMGERVVNEIIKVREVNEKVNEELRTGKASRV